MASTNDGMDSEVIHFKFRSKLFLSGLFEIVTETETSIKDTHSFVLSLKALQFTNNWMILKPSN